MERNMQTGRGRLKVEMMKAVDIRYYFLDLDKGLDGAMYARDLLHRVQREVRGWEADLLSVRADRKVQRKLEAGNGRKEDQSQRKADRGRVRNCCVDVRE